MWGKYVKPINWHTSSRPLLIRNSWSPTDALPRRNPSIALESQNLVNIKWKLNNQFEPRNNILKDCLVQFYFFFPQDQTWSCNQPEKLILFTINIGFPLLKIQPAAEMINQTKLNYLKGAVAGHSINVSKIFVSSPFSPVQQSFLKDK